MNIKDFTMRWATRSVRPAAATSLVLAAIGAAACGSDFQREGQASSYLIIQLLQGSRCEGDLQPVLRSDVVTGGGVCEDNGEVAMTAAMRDVTNPNTPTDNNLITVNRYHVSYRRSDGRNTPGVDVPFDFDGAVTFTIRPGDEIGVPFSLVRAQAKLESPLKALRGLGNGVVISTIADVTFYGHDQAGRETSVTGKISVNFADWADEE